MKPTFKYEIWAYCKANGTYTKVHTIYVPGYVEYQGWWIFEKASIRFKGESIEVARRFAAARAGVNLSVYEVVDGTKGLFTDYSLLVYAKGKWVDRLFQPVEDRVYGF